MKQVKFFKEAMKLKKQAEKQGNEFEKKYGRRPTEEEATKMAKELAADLLGKIGLDQE